MDTIFHVWEAMTSVGPDGHSSDPQEFKLVHVRFSQRQVVPSLRLASLVLVLNKPTVITELLPTRGM